MAAAADRVEALGRCGCARRRSRRRSGRGSGRRGDARHDRRPAARRLGLHDLDDVRGYRAALDRRAAGHVDGPRHLKRALDRAVEGGGEGADVRLAQHRPMAPEDRDLVDRAPGRCRASGDLDVLLVLRGPHQRDGAGVGAGAIRGAAASRAIVASRSSRRSARRRERPRSATSQRVRQRRAGPAAKRARRLWRCGTYFIAAPVGAGSSAGCSPISSRPVIQAQSTIRIASAPVSVRERPLHVGPRAVGLVQIAVERRRGAVGRLGEPRGERGSREVEPGRAGREPAQVHDLVVGDRAGERPRRQYGPSESSTATSPTSSPRESRRANSKATIAAQAAPPSRYGPCGATRGSPPRYARAIASTVRSRGARPSSPRGWSA